MVSSRPHIHFAIREDKNMDGCRDFRSAPARSAEGGRAARRRALKGSTPSQREKGRQNWSVHTSSEESWLPPARFLGPFSVFPRFCCRAASGSASAGTGRQLRCQPCRPSPSTQPCNCESALTAPSCQPRVSCAARSAKPAAPQSCVNVQILQLGL